jgi:hypothetical protein
MKFLIKYKVGKNLKDKIITANDLIDAESKANKKFKNWIDIIIIKKE